MPNSYHLKLTAAFVFHDNVFLNKDWGKGEERLLDIAIHRFLNIALRPGGLLDK